MSHPAQLAIEPARRRPVALAVEDDGFERMRLAAILDRLGFDVLSAADGAEALATLSSRRADVVVTDWQLPALSGLDLCRALRGTDPAQRPFTMLVTARDQVEDLVEGLEAGADDFIAKPYRAEELAARLRSGQRLLAMRRELGERTRMLETALSHQGRMREGFTADLTAAAQLQHQLLEQATAGIPGLALAHMFRPARHLGGDVFGVAPLAPGRAAFFHIDATGHGIAAALHAFAIATSVLGLGGHEAALDDPAAWVGALNERALRLGADIGCSLVVGWLDLATRQGRLCQAGLPHPLALSRAGLVRRLGNGGLPVGGLDGAHYVTTEFTLEQGERLVLHSDGVTDCVDPAGAPFGSERLARVLAAAASRPIGELVRLVGRDLDDWRGTAVHDDDLSLMVLETGGER
jgi:sigma-B regulation protein RsbU (phosphoserine phosphatase)